MKSFKAEWEEFVSPGKGFEDIWKSASASVSSKNFKTIEIKS